MDTRQRMARTSTLVRLGILLIVVTGLLGMLGTPLAAEEPKLGMFYSQALAEAEACVVDDRLLIGTDYGHTDTSSDVDAIAQFRQRTDISELSKHKIISDNPRRLYGL